MSQTTLRTDIEAIAKNFVANITGTEATFHHFLDAVVKRDSGVATEIGSAKCICRFPATVKTAPSAIVSV